MSEFVRLFRWGRFIWTVLVVGYFLLFFRNLIVDAAPGRAAFPLLFAMTFVLWLGLEYYFGAPFFQSGVVEHSAFWRGVFAFFVYPFIGYAAADFIWWHRTQLPVPTAISGLVGLAVFGLGTYIRLDTLFGLLRIVQVKKSGKGGAETTFIPEKKLVGLRFQRLCRHPRYFATFIQLVGIALVFRSWGGLVLALAIGLPLVLIQSRYEDVRLRAALKAEQTAYFGSVPHFWPRLTPAGRASSR